MEQLSPRVLQLTRDYISQGYGYSLAVEYAKNKEREEREEKISVERENIITILEIKDELKKRREVFKWVPRDNCKMKECEDHLGNKFNSISEMCNYWHINLRTYANRRRLGWTLKKTLTLPIKSRHRGKLCKDHRGNSFESKRKMCKFYNITTWAFSKRIKDGWSLERALMQPMKKRR